jgi:hypothetical protein
VAAAFDTASNSGTFASVSSVSWTHTPTPGLVNPVAIVSVAHANGAGNATTVTYDGVSMVSIGQAPAQQGTWGSGASGYAEMFQLTGIPTASGRTVVVNFSVPQNAGECGCQTYGGVNQATPVGTPVSASIGSSGAVVAHTNNHGSVVAGNMVVDNIAIDSGHGGSEANNQTLRFGANSSGYWSSSQDTTSSGSVDMTWSWGSSSFYAHISVELLAAAAGGGAPPRIGLWGRDQGVIYSRPGRQ